LLNGLVIKLKITYHQTSNLIMNIALRSSGGRGEYELAGSQGGMHVHDVFGLKIYIEILPGVAIDAHSRCELKNGKPRLRLENSTIQNSHPASVIAAAMLLPKPIRDKREALGTQLITWEGFVIRTIQLDVKKDANSLTIAPTIIRIENANNQYLDLDFAERMTRVVRVWASALKGNDNISEAVRNHAKIFTSIISEQQQLPQAFRTLYDALGRPLSDILPLLEAKFKLASPASFRELDDATAAPSYLDENIQKSPEEARIERVRHWRLTTVRGATSSAFRESVREAYNFRCLFSGQRLPMLETTSTAGVDAAHILPWSLYDLDAVFNGLCLNKQCHWAFDEGLLMMEYDDSVNAYVVSIPKACMSAAKATGFDINCFAGYTGIVHKNRLPENSALWPSVSYLNEWNKIQGLA
jgi:hypothetical protein